MATKKNTSFRVRPDSFTTTGLNSIDMEKHEKGAIVWDSTINSPRMWDGNKWQHIAAGGGVAGIEFTGGFAGKPSTNDYAWQAGIGISYSADDADNEVYKTFSLDRTVHLDVDTPYWSDPAPADHTDKGVFGGSYLPLDVDRVFDYSFVDSDTYNDGSNVQTTGRIDLSQLRVGDKVEVRFDFNVIVQIPNTRLQPAIWYKNRDANDNVTFSFPLTAPSIYYGTEDVGASSLERVEMSIYIASQEDINAIAQFAIKASNSVIVQPLSSLITIVR